MSNSSAPANQLCVPLRSAVARVCFAAGVMAAGAAFVATAVQQYRASALAQSVVEADLQRARQILPGNAEPSFKLGNVALFARQDIPKSIADYREAVRLNPWNSQYWMALALAYQISGDASQYSGAVAHALEAEPARPDLAWQVALSELIDGRTVPGLQRMRWAMQHDPRLIEQGLQLSWRLTRDAHLMLDDAVPPDAISHLTFLEMLMQADRPGDAVAVWQHMIALHLPITASDARPFLTYLLRKQHSQEAAQVWNELIAATPELAAYRSEAPNAVVNSGFEQQLLNFGFDWRYARHEGVTVTVDTEVFHAGNRSMRFEFDAPGLEDLGLEQYVLLQPDRKYRLSVAARAEQFAGAGVVTPTLVDGYSGEVLAATEPLADLNSWQEYAATFRTRPQTRLVLLTFPHRPAGAAVRGTLWIDDVEITEEND